MNENPELFSALEYALLGLFVDRPCHGYAAYQSLRAPGGLGDVWHIKQSHFYALTNRLAEAGFLRFELQPQPPRPPRKVFHLTRAGRERLVAWRETPVANGRELRLAFLAKLFFAQQAGPKEAQRLIARQRTMCRDWLAKGTAPEQTTTSEPFGALVRGFRQGQIEAMLAWLDACEMALLSGEAGETHEP